ncbi:MAG: hypothetical protein KDE59_20855, partial [Anaerolineales bacterium]|nr:hypothetical protein [Anaerolineales bacterium]
MRRVSYWLINALLLLALAAGEVRPGLQLLAAPRIPNVELDQADATIWVGESWGNAAGVAPAHVDNRDVLQVNVASGPLSWALIRTEAFRPEDWSDVTAVQALVYQTGAPDTADLKLEIRGLDFDQILWDNQSCANINAGGWRLCSWQLPGGSTLANVGHLSLVFDALQGQAATFYLDELTLVRGGQPRLWDTMDLTRRWSYGGNWYDFNPAGDFGRDPVTRHNSSASTSAGALYLRWDYLHGVSPNGTSANVGTAELGEIADWRADWRPYRRVQADVYITDAAVPLSVFFWDAETATGFNTPVSKVAAANSWQTITWDTPWPNSFAPDSVDEIRFIVNDLDLHQTGELYLDNIVLIGDGFPDPATGDVRYFDRFEGPDNEQTDFNSLKGEINGEQIETTVVTHTAAAPGGAALLVDYQAVDFTGLYNFLLASDEEPEISLDLTRGYRQLHFWARGSGLTSGWHNLKLELKDSSGDFLHTAYRYIAIDDADTEWREIVIDLDTDNADFWSYNGSPPDASQMKELILVLEHAFNEAGGTFYLDDFHFVVAEPAPLTGLAYPLEDFDDRGEYNDFQGPCGELNGDSITINPEAPFAVGGEGHSLAITHTVTTDPFAGYWCSLKGHDTASYQSLDMTDIFSPLIGPARDIEQIQLWVRGSGQSTRQHIIKFELKDATDSFERTAYRYIFVDDSDTTWRLVVLDADVTNGAFWRYNDLPPDPTTLKLAVWVLEDELNADSGTFYLDNIHFVDADDTPFDLNNQTDDAFLELVSRTTFMTFLDWRDPVTGLYQDRSVYPDVYSTAATGFGLTALIVGVERGWIDRSVALTMVEQTLQTLRDSQLVDPTASNGYRGWFYHFLGADGLRKDDSELSSVDSAILLFGVLAVKAYFTESTLIQDLAEQLYAAVEWPWMLDGDNQFYLGWKPECNGTDYQIPADGGCFSSFEDGSPLDWDIYTDEVIMISLLAIGAPPPHQVDVSVFYEWWRNGETYGGHTAVTSWNGSFFTYLFAHLWVDFRTLGPDNHPDPTLQVDWWENSVQAALASREFASDHADTVTCDGDDDYTTYLGPLFAATAADGQLKYVPYGFELSALEPPPHDGTIAPYGPGSAMMFVPDLSLAALRHFFSETDAWHYRYGFADAYNLDPADCGLPWYGR